ncbi:MAG: CBS domain-containing protein [Myxococcota bacterium]
MNQPVRTCRRTDSLNRAAQLMWDYDCGVLPVVDDRGLLVGIITDRDICMGSYTQGRSLLELVVETAMATPVFACHLDDEIETAEYMMSDKKVRRLPVVDAGGRPVGVISLSDIACMTPSLTQDVEAARNFAETYSAICHRNKRQLATT